MLFPQSLWWNRKNWRTIVAKCWWNWMKWWADAWRHCLVAPLNSNSTQMKSLGHSPHLGRTPHVPRHTGALNSLYKVFYRSYDKGKEINCSKTIFVPKLNRKCDSVASSTWVSWIFSFISDGNIKISHPLAYSLIQEKVNINRIV
jgi:hypothetical protein